MSECADEDGRLAFGRSTDIPVFFSFMMLDGGVVVLLELSWEY